MNEQFQGRIRYAKTFIHANKKRDINQNDVHGLFHALLPFKNLFKFLSDKNSFLNFYMKNIEFFLSPSFSC